VAQKNITENRKLCIYQTIIQSILMYGAQVWKIPTTEINKILSKKNRCVKEVSKKIKDGKNKE
jgi:hypothetical protein